MSDTLESDKTEKSFDKLQFMRIFDPRHIPKYLVEQIKNRPWDVDDWYKMQKAACVVEGKEGPALNPLNLLYAISDDAYHVVGFLWAVVSPLEKALVIQNYSMDKDYWVKGGAVDFLAKYAKEIVKGCSLRTIFWMTNYPRHGEKHGFKRSKTVIMEWSVDDGKATDGEHKADGSSGAADTGAKELPEPDIDASGTGGDPVPNELVSAS